MSTTTTPAHAARAELQSFAGELIGPDDTEYDDVASALQRDDRQATGADRTLRER